MRFHFRRNIRMRWDVIIFSVSMLLYLLNRFIFRDMFNGIIGYLLRCHFNDFLGGICICAYIDFMVLNSKFYFRYKFFKLYQIILICFICGLLWEYIFPFFWKHGTSDFFDVIAYSLGGVVYWCMVTVLRIRKRRIKNRIISR